MFTYMLQPRHLKSSDELVFPNEVILRIRFRPSRALGNEAPPGRTAIKAQKAVLCWDANSGFYSVDSAATLDPIQAAVEYQNLKTVLTGNELETTTRCETVEDLLGLIQGYFFLLPPLLSVGIYDPLSIAQVSGEVGGVSFNWEHREIEFAIPTTDQRKQEAAALNALHRVALFSGLERARLAVALHYFYLAQRLSVAGESPWEFMPASILFYDKALTSLFARSANSHDDVRRELQRLGVSDTIRERLLAVMKLRDQLDVGHPDVWVHSLKDLIGVYSLLATMPLDFQRVLDVVLERCEKGEYDVLPSDTTVPADVKKMLQHIRENVKTGPRENGSG